MSFAMPMIASGSPPVSGMGSFKVPDVAQRLAEQSLYSTYRFPAGTGIQGSSDFRFFQTPRSQPGQGFTSALSFSETNTTTTGMLSGSETFEASAIACEVLGAVSSGVVQGVLPADLRLFQRIGVFQWDFTAGSATQVMIAPLSFVGAGGGIFGATADTGTPVTFVNNGNGQIWTYQRLVVGVSATQPFSIVLYTGNAGQTASSLAPTAETHVRLTLFNLNRSLLPTG
jgi:hypothetical protein